MKLEIQEQKLDSLFKRVALLDEEDEIKSHLAKYLCIQASGFLENTIKELIAQYHESTCKKETSSFVNNKLRRFTNIDDEALTSFLKSFDDKWLLTYENKAINEYRESLNSIIAQRNLIAHGNAGMSNISFGAMVKYYNDLKSIIAVLRLIIKK
jgi:hypothetical protein